MAGKDWDQGRFQHATESLFAGDIRDLEIGVEHLSYWDLTWLTTKLNQLHQQQSHEKTK